jgi:hypothetical protein
MKIIKEEKETKKLITEDDSENVETTETALTDAEEQELEQDLDDGSKPDASVSDIEDAVVAEVELATDGAETYSPTKAEAIAAQIKAACADFNGASWAPLEIPHKFTKLLDKCLANARFYKYHGSTAGTDLLVTGLPGSGKTAIFKSWCKERGVNFKYINAKDEDLSAAINGFSVHEVDEVEGKKVHSVVQAGSKKLLSLLDTPTVLFLDEFNRAPQQLRAQLLTLINEHQVAGENGEDDSGFITLHGLLFTVACINPAVATDPGALSLNQAERSRMVRKLDMDSNVSDALNYIKSYYSKKLAALDPEDPTYKYSYTRYAKTLNIALALLTSPDFNFDARDDQADLELYDRTMLNQRLLTDALEGTGYSKEEFLDWVDEESNMLDRDITMIHDILDSWVEPPVKVPTANGDEEDASDDAADLSGSSASDEGGDDFFSQLNGDDEEDDDLFGSTASAAGKAARVSAQDAMQRIQNFDFTL